MGVSCHGLVGLHVSMIKQKNCELFCKINIFLVRPILTSTNRHDLCVAWSGYILPSSNLTQNYYGLVYVEH